MDQKKIGVSRVTLNQNQIQRVEIHSTCTQPAPAPSNEHTYKQNVQSSSALKLSRKYGPLGRNAGNQSASQIGLPGWQTTTDSCGRTGVSLRNSLFKPNTGSPVTSSEVKPLQSLDIGSLNPTKDSNEILPISLGLELQIKQLKFLHRALGNDQDARVSLTHSSY